MSLARRAWRLQYRDSQQSIALAERALAGATATAPLAEAWSRLARGFHRLRFETPQRAARELRRARRCFAAAGDDAGRILATVGLARCDWIAGRYRQALAQVLPLRAEGMRLLRREERGMLLNGIAGCYSALGQSTEAFAYMYQALRESGPARGHGFDVVLYCNLGHELFQLGDCHEALRYLEQGIERCQRLANARLLSVLRVNRIICLTDLDRPQQALPDIEWLLQLPADAGGRGARSAGFESMAIAALRAGEIALGERLIGQAQATLADAPLPDERVALLVAGAELRLARGQPREAAQHLAQTLPLPDEGLSLRGRCLLYAALADVHERLGDAPASLRYLRRWQQFHVQRADEASRARYQAASLQTELLRLQQQRDEMDARRRATERAKAELEAVNRKLSHKVSEVQSLQAALREQAVRDFLTGLLNRRHLNDVLPSMLALARRERQPLAAAIIDLDHFKAVNDRHGHGAGDRLLAAFGAMLARRLRRSDVACRYGGEEFCVLMPRTHAQAARRKLASLLRSWRSAGFDIGTTELRGQTFSAGVADSLCVRGSHGALLAAADECVLEAKRRGRERIVVHAADRHDDRSAARARP